MNALEISRLKKMYSNGKRALNGISLQIKEGDFFALLGPNGAGKSTMIGVISSLVKKSSGKVLIFNLNLDTDNQVAKSYLGIVPQEVNFNHFETCIQIVMNQAGYYGIKCSEAYDLAEKYLTEMDLWSRRNDISRSLSGGFKRRLMITRALMNEPKMLILDEPTAGVDVELRRSMWDYLIKINNSGTTILLITHYLEEAENLCKNIAIIDQGEIVENSSMKELISKLHTETFIFDSVADIEFLPKIENLTLRVVDSHSFEVDILKGQNLNELFDLFTRNNIRIRSMRNKSNRLEELFLELVNSKNQDVD